MNLFGSLAVIIVALCIAVSAHATDAPQRIAVFGFEFLDTSHEGELNGKREDEAARLELVSQEFVKLLRNSQRFGLIDTSSAAQKVAEMRPLARCNGCDIDLAKTFDADLSVFGIVAKTSNLILELHVYLRDVKTAKVVKYARANIRGNTDETWLHGIRWLVKRRLLKQDK